MHPRWLRCSSLKYSRYSRSSRLASGAPRRPRCDAGTCTTGCYVKVNQVGSHIVVQTQEPTPHRVSIPAHKTLRIGTLNGILRSVANHKSVDRQEILDSIH